MPVPTHFENFKKELERLVGNFEKNLHHHKTQGYVEAQLRDDFLNPFFRALGWDLENREGHIPKNREVEIESRTTIEGGHKRADYLFRTDGKDRFVCEAKKPAEELHGRYAFQAKRYAWNKNLPLAVLTDFEEIKIYVVGGKPFVDSPDVGLWKSYHFKQYPLIVHELWDLLAYEKVQSGSIDKLLDCLPKKATGSGKARQQWLIKPDRSRSLDHDFLNFLDEARHSLASDLINQNDRDDLLVDNRLNEATQHILDRILFLRICEDRDIDTGVRLDSIADTWRKNYGKDAGLREKQQSFLREEPPAYGAFGRINAPKDKLWHAVVRHFRALDRRPPTHVPFFNGNLFKKHFSEDLLVSDEWLADFIRELSTDESPYLFNVISVEILGTIYERFLGKVVRPHGRGVVIEEKPEVRKAGGVYYTPSYIVDYIVEQTVGKLLNDISGNPDLVGRLSPSAIPAAVEDNRPTIKDLATRTHALTILDPACGSGSFLIRAYERVCEHWQRYFTRDLKRELDDEGRARHFVRAVGGASVPASQLVSSLAPPIGDGAHGVTRPTSTTLKITSAWEKKHRKYCWVDTVTGDVHLTVSLKREILTNNIYGVDLDTAAVEVTQLSLYLKMLENENRNTLARERELFAEEIALLPPLQDNIKNGNSLIASDFGDGDLFNNESAEQLTRIKAFDWNVGFPKIMKGKDGGFDAVIGNPPYRMLQPHNTEKGELEYLKAHYVAAEFKIELFHMFLQRGVGLLKKNGFHGHIVPTTLLNNVYAENLRKWLMERCAIQQIAVAKGRVFEDADVHTCVLIFKCEPDARKRGSSEILSTALLSEEFAVAPSGFARIRQERFNALPGTTWNILLNEDNAPLIERLTKKCVPLEHLSTINRGLITGDRDKFFSPTKLTKAYQPILTGSDVHRYSTNPSSEFVKFERPKSSGGCWDADVHLAPHKIVIRQIGTEPTASLITKPIAVTGNIFTVRAESLVQEKFLLAIINSKLTAYFWQTMFADFKSSFPQVTIFSLAQLPVCKLDLSGSDKARHDKLVGLVDKMLVLVPKLRAATSDRERETLQNAVTATDHQIDQLVYDLYSLTEDEKNLVEGNQ